MENNNDLRTLGLEIWAWRASQQPNSGDDIPRLPRSENLREFQLQLPEGMKVDL